MAKKAAKKKAVKKAAAAPAKKAAPKKLTQTQIISAIADKCDVNKKVVKQILDEHAELALAETKKNGVFVVNGIGRLVKSERKARMGRNPATGEQIKIPARKVVKFRVSKAAQEAIVPPKK